MRKKRTWLYAILAVVVIGITGVLYLKSHSGSTPPPQMAGTGNMLKFTAEKADLSNTIEVRGKSSFVKETVVYAPFTADVSTWNVQDGGQIKAGEPLFQLNDQELRRQINVQEANKKKAELETKLKQVQQKAESGAAQQVATNESEALQRYAKEATKDVQDELDRVNQTIANAELETLRGKLAKATFAAPDDGIFLFQDTTPPQKVREGDPLGKIVDVSKLQMTTSVGEYDVFHIQPGMPVDVKIDALKQTTLTGKVETISKFSKADTKNNGTAQFEILISLDAHPELIAGLSLTATIETENKPNVLTIPTLAIQQDKEGYYVHLDANGTVEKRRIQVGLETADKTEVTEGLQEGDVVVLQ